MATTHTTESTMSAYTAADAKAARQSNFELRAKMDRELGPVSFIGAAAGTWGAPNWKRAEIHVSDWDNVPSLSIAYFQDIDAAREGFRKIRAQIRERVAAGYGRAAHRFSVKVFCDARGKVYDGSIN
jgi:hypothetical protein